MNNESKNGLQTPIKKKIKNVAEATGVGSSPLAIKN
jgi:hypothetical protein